MTFLLSEDHALRKLLTGITVSDQTSTNSNTPREVGVWFGQPDPEIRSQSYPYIVIDMLDVSRDTSREMRGTTNAQYLRDIIEPNIADDWEIDLPIPVNIDYQVTTFARHPRHDRQLMYSIMGNRIPFRFAVLQTDDNTVRRVDVVDVAKRDVVENGKRLFMNAFTLRVSSEITPAVYKSLYKVENVVLEGI